MPDAPARPRATRTVAPAGRDRGLDLLRAVALVRVVAWHATGAAALTLVAAMPVMFFVSGNLFAASAERRGPWVTVGDRLRRIAPPLWLFAGVAWVAMAIGALVSGTGLELSHLPWWIVPIGDPAGSTWEGGWLATPLWYLRTLLWVMVLVPLVRPWLRRRPGSVLGVAAVGVVALEGAERGLGWHLPFAPRVFWQVGDVVLFGLFFAVGMWARSSGSALRTRTWAIAAAVAATAASVTWVVVPPPGGVVNDSHVIHMLVGTSVLCAALAAAGPLRRLAELPGLRPTVDLMGQRSLTIYLWHSMAIAGSLWLLAALGVDAGGSGALLYALLVVGGTGMLVLATGWMEDLAARRPARIIPIPRTARPGPVGPSPPTPVWLRASFGLAGMGRLRLGQPLALGALVVMVVAVAVAAPLVVGRATSSQIAFRPRVPSQAPPPPSVLPASTSEPEWWSHPGTIDPDGLNAVLADWADEHDIDGASVAVSLPSGGSWVGVTGLSDTGEIRTPDTEIDAMSVTKLFTANLVYRAVDSGLIGLDDPLPPIVALPDLPIAGRATVRQLLAHRSGLANYRDTDRYRTDPTVVQGPADAVALSVAEPSVEPGGPAVYSSTNYLILGYLLEQLTGRPFDELLGGSLLGPLGLSRTVHLAPEPGEPHFSTAGIVSDIEDLARAGEDLLVRHVGITEGAWQQMSAMDPEAGLGAGTMQFCPCSVSGDDVQVFALGYAGGHTLVAHLPRYDVVVALDVTGDFYGDDGHFEAVEPLLRSLASLLRSDPVAVVTPLPAHKGPSPSPGPGSA